VKLGIVGLGLIGGSLLRALGGVGYDADPDVRSQAAADGFGVVDSLDRLAGCDLVLVAVPPGATYSVVDQVLAAVPDAAVADTASVKGEVPERDRFVSAHPMAGAETSGWAASSADLLRGAAWAACPAGGSVAPLVTLGEAVDRLDGRIVACTAAEHDEAVARVSHVPHLVAQALARLADGGLAGALAGPAFRDMTRVARADAALWTRILAANREHCDAVLDELIGDLRASPGWAEAPPPVARDEWMDDEIDGWPRLLALGGEGRAVRRLRLEDGALRAEVAR
jgi:prephenate dehydrogenase